jgi:hypothetical protein
MTRPQARRYLSARVAAPILDDLDRRARRMRKPRSNLVEQYIAEGLKLEAHPGISFVDTPFGRMAILAAFRGLSIWEIVETFIVNDRSVAVTAEYLSLPESEVQIALRYYAGNREEIDGEIKANEEAADEQEATWRRERAALR